MSEELIFKLVITAIIVIVAGLLVVNGMPEIQKTIATISNGGQEPVKDMRRVQCQVTLENPILGNVKFKNIGCAASDPVDKYSCPGAPLAAFNFFGISSDQGELKVYVDNVLAKTDKYQIDENAKKDFTFDKCVSVNSQNLRFTTTDVNGNQIQEQFVSLK